MYHVVHARKPKARTLCPALFAALLFQDQPEGLIRRCFNLSLASSLT